METTNTSQKSKATLVISFLFIVVLAVVIGNKYQSRSPQNADSTPVEVTIAGTMVCLPHRDTSGPQTMECAFGLHGENGNYYGLHDTSASYQNITSFPTGERIEVHGTFVAGNDAKYATVGIINVDRITALNDRSAGGSVEVGL